MASDMASAITAHTIPSGLVHHRKVARTARGIWVQNKKQPLTPKQGELPGYPLIRAGASEVTSLGPALIL